MPSEVRLIIRTIAVRGVLLDVGISSQRVLKDNTSQPLPFGISLYYRSPSANLLAFDHFELLGIAYHASFHCAKHSSLLDWSLLYTPSGTHWDPHNLSCQDRTCSTYCCSSRVSGRLQQGSVSACMFDIQL